MCGNLLRALAVIALPRRFVVHVLRTRTLPERVRRCLPGSPQNNKKKDLP